MKNESSGCLISLSGLDGSGKSTQAKALKEFLECKGFSVNVIHLKTIQSRKYLSNVKEKYEEFILNHNVKDKDEAHQICCAFLFCEKVYDVVYSSLIKYDYTIMDRYRDSALCNQVLLKREYKSTIEIYNSLIEPSFNIFIDYPPNDCYIRLKSRKVLSPFETPEYLNLAYDYYCSNSKRFHWINGMQDCKGVTKDILKLMDYEGK